MWNRQLSDSRILCAHHLVTAFEVLFTEISILRVKLRGNEKFYAFDAFFATCLKWPVEIFSVAMKVCIE